MNRVHLVAPLITFYTLIVIATLSIEHDIYVMFNRIKRTITPTRAMVPSYLSII
ncbi:hypothetical protein JOC31_001724 [Streptococcus saliviloxodontae]|uniref:Uncharacterized protein n=1 Tax=Streptococcus saliviloxodontae TaxID=1349416 RepID=A0ABS2PPJ9_9STRE|nr:hypothetical protein [Streptococcus saliviloxodontae]